MLAPSLDLVRYPLLAGLDHCVTGRSVGDGHRGGLRAALGLEPDRVVRAEQVHGGLVARVGAGDGGQVAPGADALVTDARGVRLMLLFADCVPILFWDPETLAVGAAHAGWRGTAARIAESTVATLGRPISLKAVIGPCIGACCYEVSDDVAEAVQATVDAPVTRPGPRGRPHLDLAAANRAQLLGAGLRPENVYVDGTCTSCNVDRFFSHRAEQGRAGRFAAVIGLPA